MLQVYKFLESAQYFAEFLPSSAAASQLTASQTQTHKQLLKPLSGACFSFLPVYSFLVLGFKNEGPWRGRLMFSRKSQLVDCVGGLILYQAMCFIDVGLYLGDLVWCILLSAIVFC